MPTVLTVVLAFWSTPLQRTPDSLVMDLYQYMLFRTKHFGDSREESGGRFSGTYPISTAGKRQNTGRHGGLLLKS